MFVREKVIKAILDSGENFMSGEQLSKKLGISRTAVWKHINALREEGYNIESVNKKGYRLAEKPDDILSSENIAYNLPTEFIGKKVIHLDTVGSTNDYAKEIGNKVSGGTLIISEQQTKGKGRLGRVWKSKSGDGIWMSLIIKPKIKLAINAYVTSRRFSFIIILFSIFLVIPNARIIPFSLLLVIRFAFIVLLIFEKPANDIDTTKYTNKQITPFRSL